MQYRFRWNDWNSDHIAEHGVDRLEAEQAVNNPAPGYPQRSRNKTYTVWGRASGGRFLQVTYVFDPPGVVFVIHSRDLTEREKQRLRRRGR